MGYTGIAPDTRPPPPIRYRDGWLAWQSPNGRWWQICIDRPDLGAVVSSEESMARATRLVSEVSLPQHERRT